MNPKRYNEEDFPDFLQDLIANNRLNDSKQEGITKLVIDKGYEVLTSKQKHVFEQAIDIYTYEECSRCGEDIPWSEMSAAEDNGKICSWCAQLTSHDD